MTSTAQGKPDLENAVIREILQTLAEREINARGGSTPPQAAAKEMAADGEGWLEFVVDNVSNLPWHESNLPDGRTPPQPRAAVGLITLLATVLTKDTIAPSSVNATWAGGVAVEWHIGGIDLEIACQPDGTSLFNFEDSLGEEHEGTVPENPAALRTFVDRLPTARQRPR